MFSCSLFETVFFGVQVSSKHFFFRRNSYISCLHIYPAEVGIYKRKQESKKKRKHAFDQESVQEKKERKKENTLSTKKATKKKRKKKENTLSTKKANIKKRKTFFLFFLTFLFSFINSHLCI